jgi:uncharacterized integral membrane protein
MSKPRLIAAVSLALFLRWLAVGRVSLTVAGATVSLPALLIVTAAIIAAAGALVALAVALARADRLRAEAAGRGSAS